MMEAVSDFVVHRLDDVPGGDGSVRAWFTDLVQQETGTAQLSWLSSNEQMRAARLRNPLEHQRYIASRVLIRRVLSDLTGIVPEDLGILRDKCGKPFLTLPGEAKHQSSENSLRFNVSHSENALCIATALGCNVGVDIEVVNPNLDVLTICKASLQSEDIDQVQRASPNERSLVFYRLWTMREAFAKMLGHGINSDHLHRATSMPWALRSFEFTLGERQIVGSVATSTNR